MLQWEAKHRDLQALNGSLGKAERARFYFAHDHTLAGLAAWLGLFGSPGPCSLNETQALVWSWLMLQICFTLEFRHIELVRNVHTPALLFEMFYGL